MSTIWFALKGFFGGFSLTAWLIIGAVGAALLYTAYVYGEGKAAANAAWVLAQKEARIERLELEARVAQWAKQTEDALQSALEEENANLQKKVEDYADEIAKRPDRCLLGPDADRLNSLR